MDLNTQDKIIASQFSYIYPSLDFLVYQKLSYHVPQFSYLLPVINPVYFTMPPNWCLSYRSFDLPAVSKGTYIACQFLGFATWLIVCARVNWSSLSVSAQPWFPQQDPLNSLFHPFSNLNLYLLLEAYCCCLQNQRF